MIVIAFDPPQCEQANRFRRGYPGMACLRQAAIGPTDRMRPMAVCAAHCCSCHTQRLEVRDIRRRTCGGAYSRHAVPRFARCPANGLAPSRASAYLSGSRRPRLYTSANTSAPAKSACPDGARQRRRVPADLVRPLVRAGNDEWNAPAQCFCGDTSSPRRLMSSTAASGVSL